MRLLLSLAVLGMVAAVGSAMPLHRIKAGPMTVTIPASWSVAGPTHQWGTRVFTATGSGGRLTLSLSPLAPRGSNIFQLLPPLPSEEGTVSLSPPRPYYCQASMGGAGPGQWQWWATCLAATGTLYRFMLQLPDGMRRLGLSILRSWQHPAPASVTTAVRLLLAHRAVLPTWTESFFGRADGWFLVGGIPATAQEAFYLFRTRNGGRTWSLERYTTWTRCAKGNAACVFPGLAGAVAMAFTSPRVGVIVQGNYATDGLTVFRTENAGQTWRATPLRLPGAVERLAFARRGPSLVLAVWLYGQHVPRYAVSDDGGIVWRWTS